MKLRLLVVAVLVTVSGFAQTVPSYVPTNGLVGWWPFNGNADDESGNGNNGTVNGATLTADRNGMNNKAYNFDGNDWIGINYDSIFNVGIGSFSISCWALKSGQNNFQHLVTRNYCTTYPNFTSSYNLRYESNELLIAGSSSSLTNSGNGGCLSGVISNIGNWNHFTAVFDSTSSTYSIYINGIIVTSCNYTGVVQSYNNLGDLYFGVENPIAQLPSGPLYLEGKLDDIGIWNRALSQQEITALYNAQTCNSTSNTIIPDGTTTICAGSNVKLSSSVLGATYQWKRNGNTINGATARSYTATTGGSYTCVATCNGSALTSNAVQVTWLENKSVTLNASGNTTFCTGDSVTLNVSNPGTNYSLQWYRSNISLPGKTGTSLVVTQPGTYKVVSRNNLNGCSRISSSGITTVSNCRLAEGLSNSASEEEATSQRLIDNEQSQGISIYPNPNQGQFRFRYSGEESGTAQIQVINAMGQQVHEQRAEVRDGQLDTDIRLDGKFTAGIYIVRMVLNGGMHDSRVVVE